MKRRIHQLILGLLLLVVIPGALLALLLIIGLIGTAIESGFDPSDFLAIVLLCIPALLAWWGIRIFFRLYAGFLPRVRRSLIIFYGCVLAYCGMWLFTAASDGENVTFIFGATEQIVGLMALVLPLLLGVVMRPDPLPAVPQ